MSQPYVGEIRMFAGNFAPQGWAFCNGALLAISENTVLFNLIGTTYGGDGQTTFRLPDLQGRVPVHQGNNFAQGQAGGSESVTINTTQMPIHTHTRNGSLNTAVSRTPDTQIPAVSTRAVYGTTAPTLLPPTALSSVGGNQPHDNMQPFLCINFIISLFGVFPSQN